MVDGGTLERAALSQLERGQLSRLSAVSCRDLSPADFDARFGAAREPVLLRGACATRWTFAELRTRFAERKWHINDWERGGCDVRLSLGSFEEYVRRLADKDAEPLYLFDSSPPAALLDCLSRPSVLGDNFLEEGPAEPRGEGEEGGEGGEGEEGEEEGEEGWQAPVMCRFAFLARRPFHPGRLRTLLNSGGSDGVTEPSPDPNP